VLENCSCLMVVPVPPNNMKAYFFAIINLEIQLQYKFGYT
jgi:hypothetical protein